MLAFVLFLSVVFFFSMTMTIVLSARLCRVQMAHPRGQREGIIRRRP